MRIGWVGKIVLSHAAPGEPRSLAADASYLVTGGLGALGLAILDRRVARPEPGLRTLEGRFVRTMLFAPPVLMLVLLR